jgi:hypothetical protein
LISLLLVSNINTKKQIMNWNIILQNRKFSNKIDFIMTNVKWKVSIVLFWKSSYISSSCLIRVNFSFRRLEKSLDNISFWLLDSVNSKGCFIVK